MKLNPKQTVPSFFPLKIPLFPALSEFAFELKITTTKGRMVEVQAQRNLATLLFNYQTQAGLK